MNKKKIAFIFFAIILIIVVVELEARLLAPEYKAIKFRFEPYPYLPYIPKPDFRTDRDYSFGILFGYPAQHNSLGFRQKWCQNSTTPLI